jgi:DNA invertase Pin-like site-specific DNA recombinase
VKAFLYARVSTGEQDTGMQLREMVEFAERRSWEFEVFTDSISGAKDRRPGLDSMMAQARRRKCDVVLVYRFDRFARSTRQLVNALAEFDSLGIQFVSIHEAIDTTSPMGRFAFAVFAAIAEFERELIRGRVKSGVAHARSQGTRLGRPRVAVDLEKIAQWRAAGASLRTIASKLGISHASVVRALQTTAKCGVRFTGYSGRNVYTCVLPRGHVGEHDDAENRGAARIRENENGTKSEHFLAPGQEPAGVTKGGGLEPGAGAGTITRDASSLPPAPAVTKSHESDTMKHAHFPTKSDPNGGVAK